MHILLQNPLRRTFCDSPKSRMRLYEEIITHPSVFARLLLSWSSLGLAGLVGYGFFSTSMFTSPKKKVENHFAYAESLRWRIMSAHSHILIGMGISGLSLLTMFRSGGASRLAAWPMLSLSLSTCITGLCLLQIGSMEYGTGKFVFFMLSAGIFGMTAVPMINTGVKIFGDVFLRAVMFTVIIFGHCAAVATVAPDEKWLDVHVKVGAALGAVTAFSISHMFLPPYPIYFTIPLLCILSVFGVKTLDGHSKMILRRQDHENCDPINEGCLLAINTIKEFLKLIKILKQSDDDDD